jgi:hypothetical protein
MDFIRSYTTIRNQDLQNFRLQANKVNVINKILSRFRLTTFFVLASRTKPYILINFNNLTAAQGSKCFNILFEEAQKFLNQDGSLNWYIPFFMTSSPKAFNDQRMFYLMQNSDRMQTILDYPPISSNTLDYLTQVAYYTQAFDGQRYALYRCGQYIITPVNEVTEIKQLDFLLSNLSAVKASNTNNSVTVYQPNQSTNYITSVNGFKNFENFRNMYRMSIYRVNFFNISPNGLTVSLYFVTTPTGNFVQPAYKPFTDLILNKPIENNLVVVGTVANVDQLGRVISDLGNPFYLRQQDNISPFLFVSVFTSSTGGSVSPYTMSSISNVETDLITYLGAAGAEKTWGAQLRYWPKLIPIAICDQSLVPVILGYNSTFGRLSLSDEDSNLIPYWLDKRLYSNVYDELDFVNVYSDFSNSTTTIRTGYNQICTDLDVYYLSNFTRLEIYPFNLTKFSPFVKLRFEGVENIVSSPFVLNTTSINVTQGGGTGTLTALGITSCFKQYDWGFANSTSGLFRNHEIKWSNSQTFTGQKMEIIGKDQLLLLTSKKDIIFYICTQMAKILGKEKIIFRLLKDDYFII